MSERLGLSDAALDACASSCAAARDALARPSTATAPSLSGVTDLRTRVGEFMTALSVACGVLASAAESIGASATACKVSSDATDAQAALAVSGG